MGRLPVLFPSPLTGNKCLKLNLCSAGCLCGQAGSLPAPQQWPCWWLIWEEERSCLNRGVTAPKQTFCPFHSSLTVRPGAKPGSPGSPSKTGAAGRAQGSGRTESRVVQVGLGKCLGATEPCLGLDTVPLGAAGLLQSHTLWQCQFQVKFGSAALGSVQRPAWVRAFLDHFIESLLAGSLLLFHGTVRKSC